MPAAAPIAAVIGATVGVVQHRQAQKQGKQARQEAARADAARQAQAAEQRRVQVRKMLTERRIALANQESLAGQLGVSASSGFQGAQSSIFTQSNVNAASFETQLSANRALNTANFNQGQALSKQASHQALGGLGMNVFNAAGGFTTIGKMFT